MEDQADRILATTLTKEQAIARYQKRQATARPVVYLEYFDVDAVFRKGVFKKEEGGQIKYETTIEIIRYHEDFRPMLKRNRDGTMGPKTDEIITYQENGLLYALRLSGGVSLFDGPNPKLALKKNECWYLLPRETPIPPGIIIAKDLEPFRGLTHYALQPAEDILRKELQRRLALLERYARPL